MPLSLTRIWAPDWIRIIFFSFSLFFFMYIDKICNFFAVFPLCMNYCMKVCESELIYPFRFCFFYFMKCFYLTSSFYASQNVFVAYMIYFYTFLSVLLQHNCFLVLVKCAAEVKCMVLILDGSSEHDAHIWIDLGISIC